MNTPNNDKEPVPVILSHRKKPLPLWARRGAIVGAAVLVIAAIVWFIASRKSDPAASADGSGTAAKAAAPGKAPAGGPGGGRFGNDPNRVQPVTAVPARTGVIHVVQNGLGTVTALRNVTVKARVDGQLQSVNFVEGEVARSGQVLAVIDPKPFEVQVTQAEGQMARDQALLQNARIDLDRYQTLLAQDSIAKQQVDAQASLVRQYEGTVKVDQGAIDNARLQLSYTKITAPISGRLGLRQIDEGNMIHASDPAGVVVITQTDPVGVLFTIPQDNLPRVLKQLNSGQKLPVDAWDREQKVKLSTGFLITTDNQIDVTTGTVKLKAQFPNPSANMFPNQFVNVRMVVDTIAGATLIPTAAIQRGTQGTIVYVVKEDNTVSTRPVKLGVTEGETVAVESGVAPGELVVVDGIDRLREGGKVEVSTPEQQKAAVTRDPNKVRGGGRRGGDGAPGAAAPPGASGGSGKGGGFANLTDEQRAAIRKKMEGMTDEQKVEYRKALRERAQQGGAAPAVPAKP